MATITDLAEASSVAAADNLVISQSGTDRRVTANKFAIVGASNTFVGVQTIPLIRSGAPLSMTIGSAYALALNTTGIIIFNASLLTSACGMVAFRCQAGGVLCAAVGSSVGSSVELTTGVILAGTTGTSGKLTISAHTNGNLYIENRTASPFSLAYIIIG